jgi:riboflavin biosynthesis pyrimidine reductase
MTDTMKTVYERLVPPTGVVGPDDLAAAERHRVGDRPWVGACMVAGLDGAVVIDQRSGALSSPEDTALLAALRRVADVILVGAGTVRAEGYGPPKKPGQRIGVVTASGAVDVTTDLFTSGAGFLVMPEGRAAPGDGIPVVRAGHGHVAIAEALRRLDQVLDPPTFVQFEGGPALNGSLVDSGCLDELNLTISPRIGGGDGPRLVTGAAEVVRDYELVQLARAGSFLFGRWVNPTPR